MAESEVFASANSCECGGVRAQDRRVVMVGVGLRLGAERVPRVVKLAALLGILLFHAAKLLMLHVQPLLQLDHQLPLVVKLLY